MYNLFRNWATRFLVQKKVRVAQNLCRSIVKSFNSDDWDKDGDINDKWFHKICWKIFWIIAINDKEFLNIFFVGSIVDFIFFNNDYQHRRRTKVEKKVSDACFQKGRHVKRKYSLFFIDTNSFLKICT